MVLKINTKSFFVAFSIITLVLSSILSMYLPFFKYTDELLFVISVCLVPQLIKKHNQANFTDVRIVILITIIGLLGIIGNILNQVQSSKFAIAINIIAFTKIMLVFIIFRHILTEEAAYKVAKSLSLISKIFIISATLFGILSLFVDLGMSDEVRFGIAAYTFIFEHEHILAIVTMTCLMFVCAVEKRQAYLFLHNFSRYMPNFNNKRSITNMGSCSLYYVKILQS